MGAHRNRYHWLIALVALLGPVGTMAHTGAHTNEGVAVCLMGHVEVQDFFPTWEEDKSVDCERYEK